MRRSSSKSGDLQKAEKLLLHGLTSEEPARDIRLCDLVLAEHPDHLPALEVKSKALWRQGHYDLALETIQKAMLLYPFDPGYHFLAGDCLQNLRRHPEALAHFERCRSSENGRLGAEAEARIAEIEGFQEGLIRILVKQDSAFRAGYRADPENAAQESGFRFAAEPANETLIENLPRRAVWARPS